MIDKEQLFLRIGYLAMMFFIGSLITVGLIYGNETEKFNIWHSVSNMLNSKTENSYTGVITDYTKNIPECDSEINRTIILRLDDIKAWQYPNVRANMVDDVLGRDMAITLGVIPKDIEKDKTLFQPWIKELKNNLLIEIALHGYMHKDAEFKDLSLEEAEYKIQMAKKLLFDYSGVIPVTFIPPENLFSEGTTQALSNEGFRVLAAGDDYGISQYTKMEENMIFIRETGTTYNFNESKLTPIEDVLNECKEGLDNEGLCVIEIHPQDYLTEDRHNIDEAKYSEFLRLLDGLEELNADFKTFREVANCKASV